MAGWAEEIYARLPAGRDLAATLKGYLLNRQRYGRSHRAAAEAIRERGQWPLARILDYQADRLRHILRAASNTPYYRTFLSGQIQTPDDLRKLPLLEKEEIRKDPLQFVDQRLRRRRLIEDRTTGTTGTPLRLFMTPEVLRTHYAYFDERCRKASGLRYGTDPYVMVGARQVVPLHRRSPPFWCYNYAGRQLYMSAYHLGPDYLDAYCRELRRRPYRALMGYPSVIAAVGRHILERGTGPIAIPIAITQGETVPSNVRRILSEAFRCRVFEQYGCSEMCVFAQECGQGSLHVSLDYGILEILDEDGNPTPPGVTGHVVCTGLVNDAQPLIRYRLQDMAAWSPYPCPCGSPMPALASIDGRASNAILLPDGRRIFRVGTIAENISAIRECQIVQEGIGEFTLLVSATSAFTLENEGQLRRNLAACVGRGARIAVRRCPAIPRGPGGKFAFIVSKVSGS